MIDAECKHITPDSMKKISITVATCNRQDDLRECLASIHDHLDYPKDLIEVNVIDNEGSEDTRKIVDLFGYNYFYEPVKGISAVRNRGIIEATNDYIAFIDDDATVSPQWATVLNNVLQNDMLFTGELRLYGTEEQVKGCEPRYGTFWGGSFALPIRLYRYANALRGSNMIIPKIIFDNLGLFHKDLVFGFEESYYSLCAREKGYRIRYVPDAVVYHKGHAVRHGEKLFSSNTNLIRLMLRHYQNNTLKKILFIIGILAIKTIQILYKIIKLQWNDARMIYRGVKEGFRN